MTLPWFPVDNETTTCTASPYTRWSVTAVVLRNHRWASITKNVYPTLSPFFSMMTCRTWPATPFGIASSRLKWYRQHCKARWKHLWNCYRLFRRLSQFCQIWLVGVWSRWMEFECSKTVVPWKRLLVEYLWRIEKPYHTHTYFVMTDQALPLLLVELINLSDFVQGLRLLRLPFRLFINDSPSEISSILKGNNLFPPRANSLFWK